MTGEKRAAFRATQVALGVYHIMDSLNVCCTLLTGQRRALLLDTGYGLFDVRAFVRTITPLPLTVLLSHGHHDHACGGAWFDEVFLLPKEMEVCRRYTRPRQRGLVLDQALDKGVLPPEYDRAAYLAAGTGNLRAWREETVDLGGMTVQVLPMPGHTPGSLGLWVTPQRLLLVGDNWNPTTWLFFPECETLSTYTASLHKAAHLPFERVLVPHAPRPLAGERFRRYLRGLTAEVFQTARPVSIPPYERINTYACHPEPETTLVFDRDKLGQ